MLATITCLLLPLQWGGNKYAWSDGVIIGTFVAFGVLVVIFTIVEWKFAGPTSILPLRYLKNRSQVGACLEAFFIMFTMLVGIYYLPIFFQATKGVTATKSGIDILAFMLSVVVGAGLGGALISQFGYYWPFLVGGPVFICIGSGLLYTVRADSSSATLIGYQILLGLGVGTVMQNTLIAVQADCDDERDIPQKTGLVTFTQLVGGTIGIAIASTIFYNRLYSALDEFAPGAPVIVRSSVSAIKDIAPEFQPGVKQAYVAALNNVFIVSLHLILSLLPRAQLTLLLTPSQIGVAAGGLASLSGLLVRNLSVKGKDLMAGGA
ncbi:hypothetical protein BCR35DRAFT_137873 [Leucosporidium creatinivorum]|uniref:Major facilitator superfamily domain-containing protein n=1 Tax=Leucosporidium creatinivorum TaxID=106004 RepID=A0A1Y2G116_9BASI|nr:hypothetical protein BCR35DRAFT_137873 [Leucosporidium creatinivorum]